MAPPLPANGDGVNCFLGGLIVVLLSSMISSLLWKSLCEAGAIFVMHECACTCMYMLPAVVYMYIHAYAGSMGVYFVVGLCGVHTI